MAPQPSLNLTLEDLKALMASTVEAAISAAHKEPPLSPKQQAEIEEAQRARRESAADVLKTLETKRNFQRVCVHTHSKRDGNGSHLVYVHDNGIVGSAGYLFCQLCFARIRPATDAVMRKLDPDAIFDTDAFNRGFQDVNGGGVMGG